MIKVDTYLFFDGNCGDAMRFYERALGGKLNMMRAKDSPDAAKFPPGSGDRILHAHLDAGGAVLMASDWMHPSPYPGMNGFSVSLSVATAGEAKSFFDKLAAGGKVTMPVEKTFYSDAFGMLVDRFGTPWMVMVEPPTED